MNQAEVAKLMSQLRVSVLPKHRRMRNNKGPEGRLFKLRQSVTALFKYERLELNYNRADETRGYAERLISDAIRNGDKHNPTMEMADFWLLDKTVVHKLFKVLVPRFESHIDTPVTRLFKAPQEYPNKNMGKSFQTRSILELKGNPFPHVAPDTSQKNRKLLHNVLLFEAMKEYKREKNADQNSDGTTKEEE